MKLKLPNITSKPDYIAILKRMYPDIIGETIILTVDYKPANGQYGTGIFSVYNPWLSIRYVQSCGYFTYYSSLVVDCLRTNNDIEVQPNEFVIVKSYNYFVGYYYRYTAVDRKIITPPVGKSILKLK